MGAKVMLSDGVPATISSVYNLISRHGACGDFWVMDIIIPLRRKECHYRPEIGVSLDGKRSMSLAMLGKECWVTDLP